MALETDDKAQLTPEVKQNLVNQLGGLLHDEWRAPRKLEDGSYDPRVKVLVKTTDGKEKWVNEGSEPEGAEELNRQDIANTNFEDLDPHWQADNRTAAEVAMGEVFNQVEQGGLLDDQFIETASSTVHDKWVERTPWADDALKVPYADLPEEEKEKDRAQVRKAIELVNQLGSNETTEKENWGYPGKRGDKVICYIDGKAIQGIIIADDAMGRDIKGILLEEKVGNDDDFMGGYAVSLGPEAMKDSKKIKKVGECTEAELSAADTRSKTLRFGK